MAKKKIYTVYFEGNIEITAEDAREAEQEAYDTLKETGAAFKITDFSEDGPAEEEDMDDDAEKKCACGLHWGHSGKHAPEGTMSG